MNKTKMQKNSRGSILVNVLMFIMLLFIIASTVISIANYSIRRSSNYGDFVRARWLAEGEMEHFLIRIRSGLELIKEKKYSFNTEDGDVDFKVIKEDETGRYYKLISTARSGSATVSSSRGIEAFFLSDYAITVQTNWRVVADSYSGLIGGRIFVSGGFALTISGSAKVVFFDSRDSKSPIVTLFGNMIFSNPDETGEISLFRCDYNPYSINEPFTKADEPLMLLTNGNNLYFRGMTKDIQEEEAQHKLKFPEFKNQFNILYNIADSSYRLVGGNTGSFKETYILNHKLVEKDLIGISDGQKYTFKYKPENRIINQIYMRRLEKGQSLDDVVIDPIGDADAIGRKFFSAKTGNLTLSGMNRMSLSLPAESFNELGRIYYSTINNSYCSVEHPLSEFFINSASSAQTYVQGSHYTVNYKKKYLEFQDSNFINEHYYFLNERGNGSRLGFTVPLSYKFIYAYVNEKMDKNFKQEPGTVFFDNPPPMDAKIAFMIKKPKIYAKKNPPEAGIGIFVDKMVKTLVVDLSAMGYYPSKGLIVSDRPLLVTGNASYPITVISSHDIYLSNINAGLMDPKPVGIISGGIVWMENGNMKTNVVKRVFISTGAERIYTTIKGNAKGEYNSKSIKSQALVIGSINLRSKVKNLYLNYPGSLSDPNALLYSDEPFFSVQYRYDPFFKDPRNLPPGILPVIKIRWWKR